MAGKFETLWYEDRDGNYIPNPNEDLGAPKGAEVQVSRFPFQLTTNYLALDEDGGSHSIAVANSTYSPDFMLSMVRPTFFERAKQLLWYAWPARTYEPKMAVFLAAETCERCMNSLAHRHGLSWGYREGSDAWHLSGTTCDRCEHLGMGKFWVRTGEEGNYRWSTTDEGKKASSRGWEKYCKKQGMTVSEMEESIRSCEGIEDVSSPEGLD